MSKIPEHDDQIFFLTFRRENMSNDSLNDDDFHLDMDMEDIPRRGRINSINPGANSFRSRRGSAAVFSELGSA
jgi:hypothetical protein